MKFLLATTALLITLSYTARAQQNSLEQLRQLQNGQTVNPPPADSGPQQTDAQPTTPPSEWWVFKGADQKCEPSDSPADWIKNYRSFGESVTANDTKDASGKVVQTVLGVPMGDGLRIGEIYFFRGKDRCEAWVKQRDQSLDRYN